MLSVVTTTQAHDELRLDLDRLVSEGARRMLAAALEAEADASLAAHAVERGAQGRRLVVRNGHARQRQVITAAGAVEVRAPRVDDRRVDPQTGERARFRSAILPSWCRKSPKVAEVLPLLEAVQDRWRAVNGPHLVALVRADARFDKGVLVERPDEDEAAGVAAMARRRRRRHA